MPRVPRNPNIGTVNCPISGGVAAVRKDKSGRKYFVSPAGTITPSTELGQDWLIENAIIWGADGPPPGTPDWVLNGKAGPPEKHESAPRTADQVAPAPITSMPPAPPTSEPGPDPDPDPDPPDDDDDVTAFPGL